MKTRRSGLLLHITSLPSDFGIGDLGPQAYRFADFLVRSKQSLWQLLPINPIRPRGTNSPYDCISAFAGETMLISCELLCQQGLLRKNELGNKPFFVRGGVDFRKAAKFKDKLLDLTYERFRNRPSQSDFERFCTENKSWLDDYAAFVALHNRFAGICWNQWPVQFRDKSKATLRRDKHLITAMEREKFKQFLFFQQWYKLKRYCNERGIKIIGDMPIYVAYDSADLWAHPEMFQLDRRGKPRAVAGVPPDYFSSNGQLWGNPLYNWQYLESTNYHWWLERLEHNLRLFDFVRIDHFRGFFAYWRVSPNAKTARQGKWVRAPGHSFFNAIIKRFPSPPIIAEDLGHISPDVTESIRKLELPGMKVLLLAFDPDQPDNPHLPHNHIENCIVYTGTHDNNTVRGWFESEARERQKQYLFRYLGFKVSASRLHWHFIRMALASVAQMAIIPVQDVLGLGSDARMNNPARKRGNWRWQLKTGQLTSRIADKLAEMTETYRRAQAGFSRPYIDADS